jgi:anti-sigma regulatory factor (Ser/Thr protein kinase)
MPQPKGSATLPAERAFLAPLGRVDRSVTTITYPGTPSSVSEARHRVRELLHDSPRADEAELIAAELLTNAIQHTPSGDDGGTFTITIKHRPGWARIEVLDLGDGAWQSTTDNAPVDDALLTGVAECGRGLLLVAALADDCGHEVTPARGQTCWAVVAW